MFSGCDKWRAVCAPLVATWKFSFFVDLFIQNILSLKLYVQILNRFTVEFLTPRSLKVDPI